MDSSSDRTEDGCSSQKSDSMDRSWMEKKTCPHFLLSWTISSLFLSFCQMLFFFSLFYPWSLLSLHAKGPSTFLVVYDTFGQTCPLTVSCSDTQKWQMIFAKIKHIASIACKRNSSVSIQCQSFDIIFFAICYFFLLASRHIWYRNDIENIFYILYFRYQQKSLS